MQYPVTYQSKPNLCRSLLYEYHSHPVYQELVQELSSNLEDTGLQLVHCAYEYPSIMDSVKVDYSKRDTIKITPSVGFDWYVTGYCISHFDEQWGLSTLNNEGIDLFLKGIRSSPTAKGRIRYLYLLSLSFSQTFLPLMEFCQLHSLELSVSIDHDDEVILQQLIAPGSGLRRLGYQYGDSYTDTFIPLLFQQSSLEELTLYVRDANGILRTELLPHSNTNLKKLIISRKLIHLLAALIPNIVSLTYLQIGALYTRDSDLPVLTNIVQSHTLEVLQIGKICDASRTTKMLQLIEAAGNSQLMELRLHVSDYNKLPPHIRDLYKHLLKSYY